MKIIKIICSNVTSFYLLFVWLLKQIKNENFKNYICKQEQRKIVNILGNGPSLNNVINSPNFYENRTNEAFCVVNYCALSPLFKLLKPEHYVLADPLFFDRPSRDKNVEPLIKELLTINWKINIYIPFIYYSLMKKELSSNLCIHIIPFHTNFFDENMIFSKIKMYLYRNGLSCPRSQNVVIGGIYCMINSGFKDIHLYGVEHSWTTQLFVNKNNQVCLKDVHYYDVEEVKIKPWLKCSGEPYKMHEALRDLAFMFVGYFELRKYADLVGAKIVNKSPYSFIDAFIKE